jgi:phosphonate transport system substrate-binding protein
VNSRDRASSPKPSAPDHHHGVSSHVHSSSHARFGLCRPRLHGLAQAQDWKQKYPELVFAVIPAENASGVVERYTPFVSYLAKELGTKVTLRVANDYAAIIEGQRAGNIHVAMYGPSSYARARMTGVKIEPFAIETNADGTKGYHSVLWVKANSPYTKIEDLKGKNLCLVDPNSTSGNNVPRFALNKMNIVPETFFGRVVYSGSHENAVIGVQQGTCDAGFNWWNDENESNLMRMSRKNMVKAEDFRQIFKSEQIVNSPMAVLDDMPADLKAAIRTAVLGMHEKDKAAFDKIYEGKQGPFAPIDHAAYEPIMELNKFVDTLRKQRS